MHSKPARAAKHERETDTTRDAVQCQPPANKRAQLDEALSLR